MLKKYIAGAGLPNIAPHDLRRTTAKLCRAAGGELEQIQLLLGHSSVQEQRSVTWDEARIGSRAERSIKFETRGVRDALEHKASWFPLKAESCSSAEPLHFCLIDSTVWINTP